MAIDIRNNTNSLTYETFVTSTRNIELCNEHMMRLASRLTPYEMVLALMMIPGIRLSECKRIADHYTSVLAANEARIR